MDIKRTIVTPDEMKELENASQCEGVSLSMLMDNAGAVLSDKIISLIIQHNCSSVVYLCGSGNNGGDGFVSADIVQKAGYDVCIIMISDTPKSVLAQNAFTRVSGIKTIYVDDEGLESIIKDDSVVVDCIFGTGFHGKLDDRIKKLFAMLIKKKCVKVACDIPSGVCSLNGYADESCINFDYTVTFGAVKCGMLVSPGREICGKIIIGDIGIPESVYKKVRLNVIHSDNEYVREMIPKRLPLSHKGDFGKLINISGSECYTGAACLSTLAALRTGVGICTLASTKEVINVVGRNILEATFIPLSSTEDGQISASEIDRIAECCNKVNAVLIGCGLGLSDNTRALVYGLLERLDCTVILDADGINAILDRINILRNTRASIILTPHPGELARLTKTDTKTVLQKRLQLASQLSKEYNVVTVAKGSGTFITTPDGKLYVSTTGNAGLSRGGSGDVLAGMIASFAAQGLSAEKAACAGTYLHGLSADMVAKRLSMQGMLPSDIINELPLVFKAICG